MTFLHWLLGWLFPPQAPGRLTLTYHPESPVDSIFAHFQPPKSSDTAASVHYILDGAPEQATAVFKPSDLPNAPAGTLMAEIDAADASKGEAWLVFTNKFKSLASPHQSFDVAALFPNPETPGMLSFTFGGQTADVPANPTATA